MLSAHFNNQHFLSINYKTLHNKTCIILLLDFDLLATQALEVYDQQNRDRVKVPGTYFVLIFYAINLKTEMPFLWKSWYILFEYVFVILLNYMYQTVYVKFVGFNCYVT